MKALLTYEPSDIANAKQDDCNVSFLSTPIYLRYNLPALNAPCPCGSGKKYKRCCGKANNSPEIQE